MFWTKTSCLSVGRTGLLRRPLIGLRTVPKSDPNHIAAVVDIDEDNSGVGGGVLDDSLLELLADDLASIGE